MWAFTRTVAVTAVTALVLTAAGCSCEDPELPEPEETVVPAREADPPQPTEDQPSAPAGAQKRQVGDSILQAPADYVRTVAITVPRRARRVVDTAYTQAEIGQFHALKGRYPRSLDELAEWRGEPLPEPPRGHVYAYDSSTGKVDVVPEE